MEYESARRIIMNLNELFDADENALDGNEIRELFTIAEVIEMYSSLIQLGKVYD